MVLVVGVVAAVVVAHEVEALAARSLDVLRLPVSQLHLRANSSWLAQKRLMRTTSTWKTTLTKASSMTLQKKKKRTMISILSMMMTPDTADMLTPHHLYPLSMNRTCKVWLHWIHS